jgi:hypothetical protein
VQLQGQEEQARVLLVSVPYAFKAHEADTLGGRNASDFVLANQTNPSVNSINANQASLPTANNLPATTEKIRKSVASDGPTNFSGSTTDHIVGVTQSGTGDGLRATAVSRGIVGTATGSSGTTFGVYGWAQGAGGIAVHGSASAKTGPTIGVKGKSVSPAGTGVRGIDIATTGSTTGVSAYVNSAAGTAAVFDNAAGGKILSGQNNAVEQFSVDGSGSVKFGMDLATLSIGSPADHNFFLGVGAGASDVPGSGIHNFFAGYHSGFANTTATQNTFIGVNAGSTNTTGSGNTYIGWSAGLSSAPGTVTCCNTFVGDGAGYGVNGPMAAAGDSYFGHRAGEATTTGGKNTFSGYWSGLANQTGSFNSFYGDQSGQSMTSGDYNTFLGISTAGSFISGNYNTFVGAFAGNSSDIGNNNIYVGNVGTEGSENNTIRIGGDTGSGYGAQTATYVAAVYNSTVVTNAADLVVCVNPSGGIYGAAPMTPNTCAASLSANQLQKQQSIVTVQQDVIQRQQEQINDLQQRLSHLEALIANR